MSQITAIEPQRRRGRFNIFVDGEFVIGVGEAVVARLRLAPGTPFEADRLSQIGRAEELQRAMDASARLLEVRPRATREIRDRLRQKGFDEAVIDEATQKLTSQGFLDDAQFSRLWVESRARTNRAGSRKMRSELMAKGVDGALIDDAVSAIGEGEELTIAAALVAKNLPRPSSDAEERKKQTARLIALLQRRGLGWGTIKQATAHLRDWKEQEDE